MSTPMVLPRCEQHGQMPLQKACTPEQQYVWGDLDGTICAALKQQEQTR